MGSNGRGRLFLLMFALLSTLIYGNITLVVDKNKVYLGEVIDLKLVIEDSKERKIDILGMENFEVIEGGTSNSYSNVNGKSTTRHIKSYRLVPKNFGKFNLMAHSRDKEFESNLVEIEVLNEKRSGTTEKFSADRYLEDRDYYYGEKIVMVEQVSSQADLKGLNYIDGNFSIEGMAIKDLNEGRNGYSHKTVNINGRNTLVVDSFVAIIEPLSSGEKLIPQRLVRLVYADEKTSGFFYQENKEEYLKFDEKSINIKPLPVLGRPDSFKDVVGRVEVESEVLKDRVEVGEGITMNIKLKGNTNLDKLDKLLPNGAKGFRVFENVKEVKESIKDSKYYVEKEFEVVFIPQKGGIEKLPDIVIDYFDTEAKEYKKTIIEGSQIRVDGVAKVEEVKVEEVESIIIDKIDKKEYTKVNKSLIGVIVVQSILIFSLLFTLLKIKIVKKEKKISKNNILKEVSKCKRSKDLLDLLHRYITLRTGMDTTTVSIENLVKESYIEKDLAKVLKTVEECVYCNKEVPNDVIEEVKKILKRW